MPSKVVELRWADFAADFSEFRRALHPSTLVVGSLFSYTLTTVLSEERIPIKILETKWIHVVYCR